MTHFTWTISIHVRACTFCCTIILRKYSRISEFLYILVCKCVASSVRFFGQRVLISLFTFDVHSLSKKSCVSVTQFYTSITITKKVDHAVVHTVKTYKGVLNCNLKVVYKQHLVQLF